MIKYVLKCVIIFIMILILGVLLLPLIKFNEVKEKEVNNTVYTAKYEVLNNEIGGNQYERILSII